MVRAKIPKTKTILEYERLQNLELHQLIQQLRCHESLGVIYESSELPTYLLINYAPAYVFVMRLDHQTILPLHVGHL